MVNWFSYKTVWRWHFYASLFCMPFVIVLSITGAIYLFKPQLDSWRDRQYDNLNVEGNVAPISAQVKAACERFPGFIPVAYELPTSNNNAGRVLLQLEGKKQRVFIHPQTLDVLGSRPDDGGFIRQIRSFHGQLGLGEKGSYLVELASSWTIVMILTGLYLWWPRKLRGLGGVLYPRLRRGTKTLLRDLHSTTGVWISFLALFLLATGLPWAKFWGSYLKTVRSYASSASTAQDWSLGGVESSDQNQKGAKLNHEGHKAADEHSGHTGEPKATPKRSGRGRDIAMPEDLTCFDRVAEAAGPFELKHPATIEPPAKGAQEWIAKSDTQNRPYRITLKIDAKSGEIISREDFSSRSWIDKLISIGIAAHEGQLFGWLNQLLGLLTAFGLVLLSLSGYVMWWRRRKAGELGAPKPSQMGVAPVQLFVLVLTLAIYIPMFGLSLLVVVVLERTVLCRIPNVQRWLGLRPVVQA